MSLTYSSYLKVHELLNLQEARSDGPEHDEMLFIIIHQVYELWFEEEECCARGLDFLFRGWWRTITGTPCTPCGGF